MGLREVGKWDLQGVLHWFPPGRWVLDPSEAHVDNTLGVMCYNI